MKEINTVAIFSPGEMGLTVGKLLQTKGYRVLSYVTDRSQETRNAALQAEFVPTDSFDGLVGGE